MPKPTKYIAFLRGINVGGNKKVEMAKLRETVQALGYTDVSTYINSGNILLTSTQSALRITKKVEQAIQKVFGFAIPVVVRDLSNIQMLCKKIPAGWQNNTKQKTDVLFLWEAVDRKDTLKEMTTNPAVDHLLYLPGAIVWNIQRKQYAKSGMHSLIGSAVYKQMTARNINTVRKLGGTEKRA